MERKPYSSDLTDAQWELLKPLIPPPKPGGRPRQVDMREVCNGIFYLLPHDFPPYTTVSDYYHQWRRDGVWEQINMALREQVRVQEGREKEPSLAIIDSQSTKTTDKGGRNAVTMLVRKLKAASDISLSIR